MRWIATPHKDRMAKVGVGIDCIHFVREILVAGGTSERFDLPYYVTRWGIGRGNNIMERLSLAVWHAESLPPGSEVKDGDIFVFAVGRQSNHCGIAIRGQCWHAQARFCVHPIPIDKSLMDRLQAIIRITRPGFKRRPETITREECEQ